MFDEEELKEIPTQYNEDDRAQRCLNVFSEMEGQVNLSYVNSTEHIVAWHKHEKQSDYWFCVKGSFKVGIAYPVYVPNFEGEIIDENGSIERITEGGYVINVEWFYLSDKEQKTLKIPPGVYHGYKALEENSILMYGLTHKYDPNDEFRADVGEFGEDWGTENK